MIRSIDRIRNDRDRRERPEHEHRSPPPSSDWRPPSPGGSGFGVGTSRSVTTLTDGAALLDRGGAVADRRRPRRRRSAAADPRRRPACCVRAALGSCMAMTLSAARRQARRRADLGPRHGRDRLRDSPGCCRATRPRRPGSREVRYHVEVESPATPSTRCAGSSTRATGSARCSTCSPAATTVRAHDRRSDRGEWPDMEAEAPPLGAATGVGPRLELLRAVLAATAAARDRRSCSTPPTCDRARTSSTSPAAPGWSPCRRRRSVAPDRAGARHRPLAEDDRRRRATGRTTRGLTNVDVGLPRRRAPRRRARSFDVALCSLGLMYVPDARRRGRASCTGCCVPAGGSWCRCGASDATAAGPRSSRSSTPGSSSDVCPMFFALGAPGALAATLERGRLRRRRGDPAERRAALRRRRRRARRRVPRRPRRARRTRASTTTPVARAHADVPRLARRLRRRRRLPGARRVRDRLRPVDRSRTPDTPHHIKKGTPT